MKNVYLALCFAGAILPLTLFAPFVRDHGLDLPLLAQQLFATPASAFFATDVVVSTLVVWVFALCERERIPHAWLAIVASLVVGVSLALPLLLYLRERQTSEFSRA